MEADIAAIFRQHGPAFRNRFGRDMLPSHVKALQSISQCRTGAFGGHLCRCQGCGTYHYRYHSCCSRFCPKCQWKNTQRWIAAKRSQLLPVRYFHLVFTVPDKLRMMIRSHQKTLFPVLFKAAVSALTDLAADPRYVGGRIGVLAVLHTWTRAMIYHPHLHCIVPGGGIDPISGTWMPAHSKYLVPIHALSMIFRARFMAFARKAMPDEDFPQAIWDKPWVVYSKPVLQGADKVLEYVGRYVHRVAITNRRILEFDSDKVRFQYLDRRDNTMKCATVTAEEFIRRFLQHVLPKGFHKIRSYGLLAPSYKKQVQNLQFQLAAFSEEKEVDTNPDSARNEKPAYGYCPNCKKGRLVPVLRLPPRKRAPP